MFVFRVDVGQLIYSAFVIVLIIWFLINYKNF